MYYNCVGGGKASDSDDDEPAAKKKATSALVRFIINVNIFIIVIASDFV